jgi:hypothetical protein
MIAYPVMKAQPAALFQDEPVTRTIMKGTMKAAAANTHSQIRRVLPPPAGAGLVTATLSVIHPYPVRLIHTPECAWVHATFASTAVLEHPGRAKGDRHGDPLR